MKALAVLPLLLLPALAHAQVPASPQIMADVHAGDFQDAAQLAAQTGDPLVAKLVTFFELTDPGGGTSDQITQFQAQNPDWPEQALLSLRAKQAAGTTTPPRQTPEFLLQAEALFDAKQYPEAAQLWAAQGTQAFDSATPNEQPLFWPDAAELARTLLLQNDAKDAYAVVLSITPLATSSEQLTDRDFLAGFLALRFLHQPTQAATWFRQLQAASPAVITQARAWYWLGRAEQGAAAQSDYEHAAAFPSTYYGQLASYALGESPIELANRIKSAQPPDLSLQDALDFSLMELPRAGVLLAQMGDNKDAAIFLNRLGAIAGDDKTRAMAAKLALSLSLPQSAVAIARSSGAAGQMLLPDGWPMPYTPPSNGPLEPSVADGIMRQESSFDIGALSPSGARGLMQLMPPTASAVARQLGIQVSLASLTIDPAPNIRLGTTYLQDMLSSFDNCLPLAAAAYNAGPHRVAQWLDQNGDPRTGPIDMVDWIELIPVGETRNYVQRVTENVVMYRAARNDPAPILTTTPWTR